MAAKIELPEPVIELVERLYPVLDMSRVSFFQGMPWFLFAQPWVTGITLPHDFRPGHTTIYFRGIDLNRLEDISLVVHECYHALQYQQSGQPSGPGFFNRFLAQYFASWTRHGYRAHPLEVPAYSFEASFRACAEEAVRSNGHADASAIFTLQSGYPVCRNTDVVYRDEAWRLALTWPALTIVAVLKFLLDLFLRLIPTSN